MRVDILALLFFLEEKEAVFLPKTFGSLLH